MILDELDYLEHYGTPRKSGRYPWGSGGEEANVSQHNKHFLDHVATLRSQGLTEKQIADAFHMNVSELRAAKSIARHEQKASDIAEAEKLLAKNYSVSEIGRKMGKNESSIRALLAPGSKDKNDILVLTSNMLKKEVAEKELIDVGRGVEAHLGISKDKLKTAISMLKAEGYVIHYPKVPQVGNPGKFTSMTVLSAPDVPFSYVFKNMSRIKQIAPYSEDGGRSYFEPQYPISIDSKRVAVRYAEEGGAKADGMIYVRPNVKDVSIGKSSYAQVRIAVDGTHYLKGMAIYKDNLPPGVDLVFNTNKSNTGSKHDAMKPLDLTDPTNPFGAVIRRQLIERDKNGKEVLTSTMNILNEEGDWDKWSRNLSSQMLSKQSPLLAKTQLDMTYERKSQSLAEIKALTNPVVRKKLLQAYADTVDASAVHLEAAGFPRSSHHVIIPIASLKDNEVYAPNYNNGERVVLIRFPHGGKFEIPEVVVNNNNKEAKSVMGRAVDAVGINHKVAQRMSGADFDGDFVLVIPNHDNKVKTQPALEGLKSFDPQKAYPYYEGMKRMTTSQKQQEMGVISNLITDMTIAGASAAELAPAIRHSMVVIDAEKHGLNYKESERVNGIQNLKKKYQSREGGKYGGASTLISRAESRLDVPKKLPRRAAEGGPIDKVTGKKMFRDDPVGYINKEGKFIQEKITSTKLAETDNAFTLSSGTAIEAVYATHSNKLKALANDARKEMVNTKTVSASPSAKKTYAKEVASLDAKLDIAIRNAPLERQAQIIANTKIAAKKDATPNMTAPELKKVSARSLIEARNITGASKHAIWITDSEWDAIQSNAISTNKLTQILDKSDLERVVQLATPRIPTLMSSTKQRRASTMLASGYTQAEVAAALGVSLTTLKTSIKED